MERVIHRRVWRASLWSPFYLFWVILIIVQTTPSYLCIWYVLKCNVLGCYCLVFLNTSDCFTIMWQQLLPVRHAMPIEVQIHRTPDTSFEHLSWCICIERCAQSIELTICRRKLALTLDVWIISLRLVGSVGRERHPGKGCRQGKTSLSNSRYVNVAGYCNYAHQLRRWKHNDDITLRK